MSYPVIVSYNSANPKEHKIVTKLLDYLGTKNIDPVGHDPNFAEIEMKQWLLNAKWLVLFLTPEAIRSPQVQSLVDAAFVRVKQGLMQGVLALAFSSNPVELEDLPPLWSTIRIYYVGERNEDQLQAFDKLSRTLGYTRVPVPATSSSTNNWASPYSSAASRPLPTIPQPARRSNSRVVIPVVAALMLIIFFLAYIFGTFWISKHGPTPTPTPDAKATEAAHRNSTVIAHANSSATAHTNATTTTRANATATAVSLATVLLSKDNRTTPDLTSLDAQDDNKLWQQDTACVLNSDSTYDVTSKLDGYYKVCMASNTSFTNFAYQVTMKIISGDAGGLIFRSNGAQQFYRFSLNSNGEYALLVCKSSICSDPKISSGMQLTAGNLKNVGQANTLVGQTTTLTVIAKANTIYLYVNQIFLNEVDDSTISQDGEIGVYAASETQPTKVVFSDVKVWNL